MCCVGLQIYCHVGGGWECAFLDVGLGVRAPTVAIAVDVVKFSDNQLRGEIESAFNSLAVLWGLV